MKSNKLIKKLLTVYNKDKQSLLPNQLKTIQNSI